MSASKRVSLSLFGCLLTLTIAPSRVIGQDLVDDAKAFVRLGYGDRFDKPFRSLSFLTDRLTTDEARAAIAEVGSYNAFDGARVAAALAPFAGRVTGYRFGRRDSPILHVELPHWTHQREGSAPDFQGERISDADHAELVNELRAVFVGELSADEFGPDPIHTRTIVVWWD